MGLANNMHLVKMGEGKQSVLKVPLSRPKRGHAIRGSMEFNNST